METTSETSHVALEQVPSEATVMLPKKSEKRVELASPFLAHVEDELVLPPQEPLLLQELLLDAPAVIKRFASTNSSAMAVQLVGIVFAGAQALVLGATAASKHPDVSLNLVLPPLSALLSNAACFGPIYATSILTATRMPLAQLVNVLLAAAAAGACVMGTLTPVVFVAWTINSEWAGALAIVAAFAAGGLVSGARLLSLLQALAASTSAHLVTAADQARINALARVAFLLMAFTTAVSLWSFEWSVASS